MGLLTYARNAARTCAASDSPLPADSLQRAVELGVDVQLLAHHRH